MRPERNGFTLVEILIVVLLLGILATMVVPQVSTASQDARLSSIRSTLQKTRGQLELFKLEHGGIPPQTSGLWVDMTHQTDTAETNVATPTGTHFGPYLQAAPNNNWNGLTTASSAAIDTAAGWYYTCDLSTCELRVRNGDGSVNYSY